MTRVRVLEEGAVTEQVDSAVAALRGVESGFAPLDSGLLIPAAYSRVKSVAGRTGDITLAVADVSGALPSSQKGAANGIAPLGSDSKIGMVYLPDTVIGGMDYQGVWDASTNTPNIGGSSPSKGDYYKVSVAGSTSLSGITDWKVGDWAVYNGSSWDKIDNTDQVTSVDGRTGVITLSDLYASINDARLRQIRDEGSALANRAILDFVGAGVTVTDDSAGGRTQVSISGASASDASETVRGVGEEATVPEAKDGTLDSPYMLSPAKLMAVFGWAWQTRLEGLRVDWQSATQVIVRAGVAWVPGANKLVELASDVTINFAAGGTAPPVTGTGTLTVNRSTAGFLYIYLNSSGQVVVSTTAPAASYRGHAKTMSGNTSTRYVESLYASAANTIRRYDRTGEWVMWVADGMVALDAVGNVGTTFQDSSLANLKPSHSSRVEVDVHYANGTNAARYLVNGDSDGLATVGGSESTPQVFTQNLLTGSGNRVAGHGVVKNVTSALRCRATAAGGAVDLSVQGYYDALA